MMDYMNDLMANQNKRRNFIDKNNRISGYVTSNHGIIVLLVDISSSMDGLKLKDAQKSLLNFLEKINEFEYAIKLVTFGNVVEHTILGVNKIDLESKIKSLEADGSTPLLEALQRANGFLTNQTNPVIVLVTDGQPTDASENEIIGYATLMKTKDIRMIVIGVGEDVNQNFLKKLASSNSDYHFAKESLELKKIYEEVAETLSLPPSRENERQLQSH
jgi:uncharacterized protein YegL